MITLETMNQLKLLVDFYYYDDVVEQLAFIVRNKSLGDWEKIRFAQELIRNLSPLLKPILKVLAEIAYKKHVALSLEGEQAHRQCQYRALDEWKNVTDDPALRRDLIQSKLIGIAGVRFALENCLQNIEKPIIEEMVQSQTVDASDSDEDVLDVSEPDMQSQIKSHVTHHGLFSNSNQNTTDPKNGFKLSQSQFNQIITLALQAHPHYDAKKVINDDYDSDDDQMWSSQQYHDSNEPNLSNYIETCSSILLNAYTSHSHFGQARIDNPMIIMQSMTMSLSFAQGIFHEAYVASSAIQDSDEKQEKFTLLLTEAINTKFETEYCHEPPVTFLGMQCSMM